MNHPSIVRGSRATAGVLLAIIAIAAGVVPTIAASAVTPNIIGFEADPTDFDVPQPFTSRDNPTVHFRATGGGNVVRVVDLDLVASGDGFGLGAGTTLVIRFDVPTTRVSFLFGNDYPASTESPGGTQEGDRATLRVFREGQLIATRHKELNRNLLVDQIIRYEGVPITRATFEYDRAGDSGVIDAAEVVDDIHLAQVCLIKGGPGPNALVGDDDNNGICGNGGADRLLGRGGNDRLDGGTGDDKVNGGAGNDLLVGSTGDDILRLADGVKGNDTAYGGLGNDTCIADPGDTVYRCETVITPG